MIFQLKNVVIKINRRLESNENLTYTCSLSSLFLFSSSSPSIVDNALRKLRNNRIIIYFILYTRGQEYNSFILFSASTTLDF